MIDLSIIYHLIICPGEKKHLILFQANEIGELQTFLSSSLLSSFLFFPPFFPSFICSKESAICRRICLCLGLVSIAKAEKTHLKDRMGLIKWFAGSGSHLPDGLGDSSVPKVNKLLERNSKYIQMWSIPWCYCRSF